MFELFNPYKICQELREVQKVLNRHGILKAGFDFLYRMINLCIHFKIYRCTLLTRRTFNPDLLTPIPGYRSEILNFLDLLTLLKKKSDWIPMDKIKASFSKNDTCFKIYDLKDRLASYQWYSTHPTMVTADLEIKFNTNKFIYEYKGFTNSNYRGQRLSGRNTVMALIHYCELGYEGLISIIQSNNFNSLKSAYRKGYKKIGTSYVFKLKGKYLILSMGGMAKHNIELSPKIK